LCRNGDDDTIVALYLGNLFSNLFVVLWSKEQADLSLTPSAPPQGPLVLLNPLANRGDIGFYRALVKKHVQERGAEYVETRSSEEAKELARKAALADRSIVVVGGDGSLHEVINGVLMAGQRVPLGIIAAGSGNDFAWNTLKLPREPEAMVTRAFDGVPTNVDAGCVNGQYFANGFSVGLDAEIGALTNSMKTWPLIRGAGLYYAAAIRQLLFRYHHCPWLAYHFEDGVQITECNEMKRHVLIAVTNGPAYGAGFRINPQANPCDGLLDICLVRYIPVWRVAFLLPGVKKGKHVSAPEASFHRAQKVVIESPTPVMLQADGEVSVVTRVEAHILPGALSVRM
jgi:diacylglycerol kinase (ATP)